MAFDFDGTLAPICANPEEVRVRASWSRALQRMAGRWPLAVISGRKLADLTPRLGFEPTFIAGNHGAESVATLATQATLQCLDEARNLLEAKLEVIGALGMTVEDKRMSLALRYRRSPRALDAADYAAELLVGVPSELLVSHGKAVFNITVRAAPDKGHALCSAMHRCGTEHALYVGDDVNDEPAFEVASHHSVTVRIGSRGVPTQARFTLATHHQLGLLLRTLARRPPESNR